MVDVTDRYRIAAQEDRSAPRTRIDIPGQLRPSGGKAFQTVVNDLSISGFSATAINRMLPGQLCWLTLPGLGSLMARMLPFVVPFWIVWTVILAVFFFADLPLGPGNGIFLG